jgi:aminoglycoside phosphotransferase (APT) family kinase protein
MDAREIGERLGAGQVAEVFAYGDGVLKLYIRPGAKPDAFREAATLAAIEPLGLPVPRVGTVSRFGDRWGLAMGRAKGKPFLDAMMSDQAAVPSHLSAMVRLHRQIHAHTVPTLPSHKAKLAGAIGRAKPLNATLRSRLLAALNELPTGDRLCHLDFHPQNILGDPANPMIVDWLDASAGDPAADVCRTHVIIAPHMPAFADSYVDAYLADSGLDRAAVTSWRPVIAGGRLAEGVPETDYLLALAEAV